MLLPKPCIYVRCLLYSHPSICLSILLGTATALPSLWVDNLPLCGRGRFSPSHAALPSLPPIVDGLWGRWDRVSSFRLPLSMFNSYASRSICVDHPSLELHYVLRSRNNIKIPKEQRLWVTPSDPLRCRPDAKIPQSCRCQAGLRAHIMGWGGNDAATRHDDMYLHVCTPAHVHAHTQAPPTNKQTNTRTHTHTQTLSLLTRCVT